MKLGIVKETRPEERRVAASPGVVAKWVKTGWEVVVERGGGEAASYPDAQYEAAGAVVVDRQAAWQSDIVLKLRPPVVGDGGCEADQMREGATLISFIQPAENPELVEKLALRKLTVLAMDQVPRISRAQKMDALSSMANIAGYRAVVEAANRFGSFFTGQFTAAGKVPPAKVLIIGGGVAGLAALGAAKGLGAIVRAFDVRPSVEDQVKSLGGEFLTVSIQESGEGQGGYAREMSKEFLEAEYALFRAQAREVDIVITTALIPGRPAPKLWFTDMVELMKPGSVIVDLAAEKGGNCELTQPGEVAVHKGVTIVGYTDLASRMAHVASDMYGTNLAHLLDEMGGAKGYKINHDNDAVRPALVLELGEKRWPAPRKPEAPRPEARPAKASGPIAVVARPAEAKPDASARPIDPTGVDPRSAGRAVGVPTPRDPASPIAIAPEKSRPHGHGAPSAAPSRGTGIAMVVIGLALACVWAYLRFGRPGVAGADASPPAVALLQHITVFVMAVFVGFQVVWNVTPALHTPLMSVTNAISGIIVVGGLIGSTGPLGASVGVAVVATLFATINIAGGFLVTRRMLAMFRK